MRFFFAIVLALLLSNAILPLSAAAKGAAKNKSKKAIAADDRGVSVVKKNSVGKRVALVIGNGNYRYTDSMPKLVNPTNDADDMATALRRFGFEVIAKKNLTKEEMDETITDFGRRAANSDASLFYYAGHGLQVRGQNYLVPVDANIDSEAKVPYRAVNVNQLLEELESSRSRVNIVMLDACRNNPISGKFRSGATRGLAPPAAMPKGTVIVYATDPGNVAADGNGRNGLFTAGLLTAFKGQDLTLGGVLTRASEEVEKASSQQQTPYINGPATVQKRFSFILPASMTDLNPSEYKPETIKPPDPQPATNLTAASDAGIDMVNVPGGCFQMGDIFGDGYDWEKPVHEVCVRDFSIGKYEVTQEQWEKVMGYNPSKFIWCGGDCPVEQVSWNDVQEFIRKLNQQTGGSFRLPTEAEWEYAARSGGKKEKYSGSDNLDAVGWYYNNSGNITHRIGSKQANGLGIHDMTGNVWEWVSDWFSSYPDNQQNDPTGPTSGSSRVTRGGSWSNDAKDVRVANRGNRDPSFRVINLGFRLVAPSVQ